MQGRGQLWAPSFPDSAEDLPTPLKLETLSYPPLPRLGC